MRLILKSLKPEQWYVGWMIVCLAATFLAWISLHPQHSWKLAATSGVCELFCAGRMCNWSRARLEFRDVFGQSSPFNQNDPHLVGLAHLVNLVLARDHLNLERARLFGDDFSYEAADTRLYCHTQLAERFWLKVKSKDEYLAMQDPPSTAA